MLVCIYMFMVILIIKYVKTNDDHWRYHCVAAALLAFPWRTGRRSGLILGRRADAVLV